MISNEARWTVLRTAIVYLESQRICVGLCIWYKQQISFVMSRRCTSYYGSHRIIITTRNELFLKKYCPPIDMSTYIVPLSIISSEISSQYSSGLSNSSPWAVIFSWSNHINGTYLETSLRRSSEVWNEPFIRSDRCVRWRSQFFSNMGLFHLYVGRKRSQRVKRLLTHFIRPILEIESENVYVLSLREFQCEYSATAFHPSFVRKNAVIISAWTKNLLKSNFFFHLNFQ